MPERFFTLFVRPTGWCITAVPAAANLPSDIPLPVDAAPAEVAAAISSALKRAGYSGNPVTVAIPSAWCLSATIATGDLPRGDSKAMLYRLEENLPLAAENIVADFVPHLSADGVQSALGVCARLDLIAPLIESLEAHGIAVQSVTPTVLATAQGLARSVTQSPCLFLCSEPGCEEPMLNVIALQNQHPTHWSLVPATAADLKLQLDLLSTQFGSIPHIEAIDIEPDLADVLTESTTQIIRVNEQNGLTAAAAFTTEVLKGRAKPWVEFRRDSLAIGDRFRLHRRWIDLALAAAIALMLSLTAAYLIRAYRYSRLERAINSELVAQFQQHFPGWEIPINVRAVVDAQYRRAAGSTDAAASRLTRGSALTTLHDVLVPLASLDQVQIQRMHSMRIPSRSGEIAVV